MIHQHVASSVPMAGMLSIVGGCGSDSEGTGFGVGASCAFCMNSAWEFKSANLP